MVQVFKVIHSHNACDDEGPVSPIITPFSENDIRPWFH